ncbi:hypothetical protein BDZ91DRAFT_190079 [Kalaharituber pfeilii]|nr:hypothetical protein BDZ91DRAFT_190079 [Kalaharituber pfeilii]
MSSSQIWADYPFPLISTPALNGDVPSLQHLDQFARSATKMALTHNVIIRGMNSIYLQCEHITPSMAASFLLYCQCWSEFIQNHHACEEVAFFPIIEKATGVEGLSEGNLEQHDAFLGGLQEFDKYVYNVHPSQFSGKKVLEILDSFAATLQSHLTDEVVWIMALSRFPNLNLAAIDNYHRQYVRSQQSQSRIIPFLLTNHDVLYEAGIHAGWPFMQAAPAGTDEEPGLTSKLKDFWLRYVCTLVHRNAWKYSCCTFAGKPRPLEGTKMLRTRSHTNRNRESALELGVESDDNLQKPERVLTR